MTLFAGSFAPSGWTFAQGQTLNISVYPSLYAAIGTTYGGNGTTTFRLPDLRGRALMGIGNGYALGDTTGAASTTLIANNLPEHAHSLTLNPFMTGNTGGGQPFSNMQPTMALLATISNTGEYPIRDGSAHQGMTYGRIRWFAGPAVPPGTFACDGSILPIIGNEILFSIIGPAFGGDSRTTFAVPDLRGRTPIGSGTGPGLSAISMGQQTGSSSITLTQSQMATHTHQWDHYSASNQVSSAAGAGNAFSNRQPSTGLHYIITGQGTYPPREGTYALSAFMGEISLFAGNYAPSGWMLCQGQSLSVSIYDTFYSVISTTYGGDGRTTFALPDLRGRSPIGYTSYSGSPVGTETITLTQSTLPAHTHSLNFGSASFTVSGSPDLYETPQPFGYTNITLDVNTTVTNTIQGIIPISNGTHRVCTGWTGTGSVPSTGSTTSVVCNITQNSTLTWQWRTEHFLDIETEGTGSVSHADGYIGNGTNVTLTATPGHWQTFENWSGDLPADQVTTNPVTLLMDQPRTLTAHFAPVPAGTNGTPTAWLRQHGITNYPSADDAELDDPDGDGQPTWAEYIADTNPGDSNDVFRIAPSPNADNPSIQFTASSNRVYTLERCTNLVSNIWQNLPGATDRPGAQIPDSLSDTNAPPSAMYRVRVKLP